MHSLALMMPVWLLCLSLFHYTVVLYRFQTGFDTLTPSVLHRYVSTQFQEDTLIFSLHPPDIIPGIETYLAAQLGRQTHPYALTFLFYQSDQQTLCWNHCQGVKTTLSFSLYGQSLSLMRHYQLVHP